MDKQAELEKLDRIIKDGEIRLKTVKVNVDSLNKEIETLTQLESQLIDNIRFLKKNKIIATASEYKKARDDLAKTVVRMVALKNDREHFRKSAKEVEQIVEKSQQAMEKLKNGSNNVLTGNFRRKTNG